MKRQIKFRAWDKRQECYQTWEFIKMLPTTGNIIHGEHENYEPEEWIGLKDDAGVEIYEGDIIKARYAPTYKTNIYEVKWNKGSAAFVCYRNHENPKVQFEQLPICPSNSMEDLEVIGNIRQTPELLTVGGQEKINS